jgi:hypothetical protein
MSPVGRGLLFDSFAVLHDRSPSDHKLPASSCACCWELNFSNQPTNCCKWNSQHGCSFVEIYEERLLFGCACADAATDVSDRTGVECRFGTLRRAFVI